MSIQLNGLQQRANVSPRRTDDLAALHDEHNASFPRICASACGACCTVDAIL
jgi:hypothetical protein